MNPTLTTKPLRTNTSAGLETVDQTVARAKQLIAPQTGFTANIPPTVPAEALNGNTSRVDVQAARASRQMAADQLNQFNTDYNNLLGRIQSPLQSTPFQNPQAFIEQTLLRRPTETQIALDEARMEQAGDLRSFSKTLDRTREKATEQFGLPDLQANLAETRNRISERTVKLRQDIRDFETNAERRGVAREFVESEKQKVQADAAAELADLAIIESSQLGNLQQAQDDIDRAVAAKVQAFEFENAAIEKEIARLDAIDTREAQARSEQLQIALQERNRLVQQAVEDEKQRLLYLSEAASNGADQGTLEAIRKSASVGEAAMMAGPWIGRLDRMQAQANLANTYSQISSRELNDTIALAEAGNPEAIAKLGLTAPDNSAISIDELAYAQQYAATGTIPTGMKDAGVSFGRIAEIAKDLPKPTGTMVNASNGVKDTSIPAAEQDDIKRLFNIVQLSKRLEELDKQRWGGIIAGTAGKLAGSDVQGEYVTVRKNIIDEITRMQTGAALTTDEQEFYGSYLPGRWSEPFGLGRDSGEVIKDFSSVMEQRLQNSLANNQLSIYGYSKVQLGDQEYVVGEVVENANGQRGIVQPDGNITLIQ